MVWYGMVYSPQPFLMTIFLAHNTYIYMADRTPTARAVIKDAGLQLQPRQVNHCYQVDV